jgi:hypothetical protein
VDHLAAKSWVRDRAVVISCEGYGSARAAAEPEKTAAKAAAKEKAAAARASAPGALVKYSLLADHVAKNIVVAQCQLRNIRFKASDKVKALRQLWKAYDENAERIGLLLGPVPAAAAAALPVARSRSASPQHAAAVPHRTTAAGALSPRRSAAGGAVLRALSPRGSAAGGASVASTMPAATSSSAVSGTVFGSWSRAARNN